MLKAFFTLDLSDLRPEIFKAFPQLSKIQRGGFAGQGFLAFVLSDRLHFEGQGHQLLANILELLLVMIEIHLGASLLFHESRLFLEKIFMGFLSML